MTKWQFKVIKAPSDGKSRANLPSVRNSCTMYCIYSPWHAGLTYISNTGQYQPCTHTSIHIHAHTYTHNTCTPIYIYIYPFVPTHAYTHTKILILLSFYNDHCHFKMTTNVTFLWCFCHFIMTVVTLLWQLSL